MNVSDDLARGAAEEFAQFDNQKGDIVAMKTEIVALRADFNGRFTEISGKFALVYWTLGTVLTFVLVVIGKLFLK